ncbi:hypothetical protein Ssi03_76160 [Sphaerisporangium siamense]|uniref:DUF3168 domain-containing protein n=1 Tax=Sphaerisporangium siamense TaxID=795645 RepID=A0A7W7G9U3_9ACTN|nr:hypothetical protein [Sphaerisporangium siamense]MBB4699296.1 hypothetical protein [Sphaerisporangium siamense]GII89626.1 hypothetical protein Ssi03_76160 [Sphaerisporangium siamense]
MISTIPAVIDALVALVRAALPGVQVVDGQPMSSDRDIVCIAFTGEPGEAAVESTRAVEQLALEPDRESYTITCLASSLRGDADAKASRDRAYGLVDTIASAIAADPRLDGAVTYTRLATESLTQQQTQNGAEATVRFLVAVEAFTR